MAVLRYLSVSSSLHQLPGAAVTNAPSWWLRIIIIHCLAILESRVLIL